MPAFSLLPLTKSYPDIRVVAYTSVTNTFIIDALYDSGVFAVVNKKEHISVLWETVLRVCRERKSMSKNTGPKNNLPFLTVREKEIAIYLSKGLAAKKLLIYSAPPSTLLTIRKCLA
ncbi:MAG: response regulator transcription factor [Saprospiraceae bacterium]|nr:response regulator transcription factor [Saprospiraceae bacterium]